MKIIITTPDNELSNYLYLLIDGHFSVPILIENKIKNSIKLLEKEPGIGIIISTYYFKNESAGKYFSYVTKMGEPRAFFLLSNIDLKFDLSFKDFSNEDNLNQHIKTPFDPDEFLNLIEQTYLAISSKEIPKRNRKQVSLDKAEKIYQKISISRLEKFNSLEWDLYLKLSSSRYIKVMNAHDPEFKTELKKYTKKGKSDLYLSGKDYHSYILLGQSIVTDTLKKNDIPIQEQLDAQLDSTQIAHELALQLNIPQNVITMVDVLTKSCMNLAKKESTLWPILQNLIRGKNYNYEHSLMIAYLSSKLLIELGWDTGKNIEKIVMASLFHDICLEDPSMCQIRTWIPQDLSKLTNKQINDFKKHPEKAIKVLSKLGSKFPKDVERIIAEHHELPNGLGLPYGKTSQNIFPLSSVFIIAEIIIDYWYINKLDLNSIKFVKSMLEQDFTSGSFGKVTRILNHALP